MRTYHMGAFASSSQTTARGLRAGQELGKVFRLLELYLTVLSTSGPHYLLNGVLERKCRSGGILILADGYLDRDRSLLRRLYVPRNVNEPVRLDRLVLVSRIDFQLVIFLIGLTTQVEQETAILLFPTIGRAARKREALSLRF